MQITSNSIETGLGPSDWFTGAVYLDAVAAPSNGSRISASSVHFTPGARTAWHTHPNGQTIWITEGVGLCQRRGGPVELIRMVGVDNSMFGSDFPHPEGLRDPLAFSEQITDLTPEEQAKVMGGNLARLMTVA